MFLLRLSILPLAMLLASPSSSGAEAALDKIRRAGGIVRSFENGWEVELHLAGKAANDDTLAQVAALGDSVLVLNLRNTGSTDDGLRHLAKLENLARLHLERTAIGDAGLAHLKNLQQLEYLNLYGTNVTDAGLRHLEGLNRLQQLFVWQTGTTEQGCASLSRALPDLHIVRGVDLDQVAADAAAQEKAKKEIVRKTLEWVSSGDPPKSKTGEFTSVLIRNNRNEPVKLYWVEYGGGLKYYSAIEAGATLLRNTFSDATWVITNKEEAILGYFISTLEPSQVDIPKS